MMVDRLLFLWVEKGHKAKADDDIQCGATESEQTSVAPITAPFWGWVSKRMRKWEDGIFFFSKEQSVLLSACQTLVSPHRPLSQRYLGNCSVYPVANLLKLNPLKLMCVRGTIDRRASLSVCSVISFLSSSSSSSSLNLLIVEYQNCTGTSLYVSKFHSVLQFSATNMETRVDPARQKHRRRSPERPDGRQSVIICS